MNNLVLAAAATAATIAMADMPPVPRPAQPSPPPRRSPSGRRVEKRFKDGAPRTLWKRYRDNPGVMQAVGADPMWGSVLGLYRLGNIITERQYQAGRLFGEIAGRYRRYHADDDLPTAAKSPAFQRGSRGRDDELERLARENKMKDYLKSAKKANKSWEKVSQAVVTLKARGLMLAVCVHDQEIAENDHKYFAQVLSAIASRYGFEGD